jgi:SIR2-like domain
LYGDLLKIGEEFAECYREWAWDAGRDNFPSDLFNADVPSDVYIKHAISEYLRSITPTALDDRKSTELAKELEALKNIRPHAIVTTNYDQFIEVLFPEYQPIVGQQIIRSTILYVGEIFKIHGCVSNSPSLVFTEKDYNKFTNKKKYLSAKLLTFFSEHPLLFI